MDLFQVSIMVEQVQKRSDIDQLLYKKKDTGRFPFRLGKHWPFTIFNSNSASLKKNKL